MNHSTCLNICQYHLNSFLTKYKLQQNLSNSDHVLLLAVVMTKSLVCSLAKLRFITIHILYLNLIFHGQPKTVNRVVLR